jgi:hypothetical protein
LIKSLEIDLFIDGYNVDEISCIDLPIAGAASFYNKENYYKYCFYTSFFLNWLDANKLERFELRNIVLKKMGLTINRNAISSSGELIPFIRKSIDNQIPVILTANYGSLYYTYDYLIDTSYNLDHAFIISGYDADKSILIIRDIKAVDRNSNPEIENIIRADPLYKMYLSESILLKIWEDINSFFKNNYPEYVDNVFTVERHEGVVEETQSDILKDVLSCDFKYDGLIEIVKSYNSMREEIKDNAHLMVFLRRDLKFSLCAFFRVLEELLVLLPAQDSQFVECDGFKKDYLNFRGEILSVIHANAIREKEMGKEKREELISRINFKNQQLSNYLHKFDEKKLIPKLMPSNHEFSYINPYLRIDAENYDKQFGIRTEECIEGGRNIGYIENGDYVIYDNLDFGEGGANLFEVRVASSNTGGNIEIRIDHIKGTLLGSCPVENTGNWQSWVNVTCAIKKVTGVHSLYLVFAGKSGYLFNVLWFRFNKILLDIDST